MQQEHAALVEELRSLQKPSSRQERLLELYDGVSRTPEEQGYLDALLVAEHTRKAAREASALATKKATRDGGKRRRARTKHLIELGGLVVASGAEAFDAATLLGGLMHLRSADEGQRARWSAVGGAELQRRAKEAQDRRKAASA